MSTYLHGLQDDFLIDIGVKQSDTGSSQLILIQNIKLFLLILPKSICFSPYDVDFGIKTRDAHT